MVGIWCQITDSILFPDGSRDIAMQPILGSKLAKSDSLPLFVALAFGNGLQYRHTPEENYLIRYAQSAFHNRLPTMVDGKRWSMLKAVERPAAFAVNTVGLECTGRLAVRKHRLNAYCALSQHTSPKRQAFAGVSAAAEEEEEEEEEVVDAWNSLYCSIYLFVEI